MAVSTRVKHNLETSNDSSRFSPTRSADEAQRARNRRRADGWMIAVIAGIALWVGVGLGIWAIARVVG
jgi:hypothetical protein